MKEDHEGLQHFKEATIAELIFMHTQHDYFTLFPIF